MRRFKNILTSIDSRADEHPALRWAETLAEHNEATLKIVDVLPDVAWPWRLATPDYDHVQELLVKEKMELLESLAEPMRTKGLSVETKVLRGRSSSEIIREVIESKHDLVVRRPKGTLSRRPGYFGSTSINLLRNCPCAVWVVKSSGPQHGKILAAVDPAPRDEEHDTLNREIMELALSICESENAEPLIVHVWNLYGESIFKGRMNEAEFERLEKSAHDSVEQSFRDFLKKYNMDYPSDQVQLHKGEPAAIIPQVVKHFDVDLVVMGTVARKGVPGMIVGNTAELILERIECGVLAVKPENFEPSDS